MKQHRCIWLMSIVLVVLFFLLLSTQIVLAQKSQKFQAGDWVVVIDDGLKLRRGAGTAHEIIATLLKDSIGQVLASNDNGISVNGFFWWNIRLVGGEMGWVAENWLNKTNLPLISNKFKVGDCVKTTDVLNLRKSPRVADDNKHIEMPKGTEVQVLEHPDNGTKVQRWFWWYVRFGGNNGWCVDEFLELCPKKPDGFAAIWDGVTVTPTTIYSDTNKNFGVTFTLKETQGSSIIFNEITVAILDASNNHLFDLQRHVNITVPANGTWTYPEAQGFLRTPGTYKAVARGRVTNWFDFTTTGSGMNPRIFQVHQLLAPTHLSPLNDVTINTTTPTFRWEAVPRAEEYALYISKPPLWRCESCL